MTSSMSMRVPRTAAVVFDAGFSYDAKVIQRRAKPTP